MFRGTLANRNEALFATRTSGWNGRLRCIEALAVFGARDVFRGRLMLERKQLANDK